MSEAVVLIDKAGAVLDNNPAAAELFAVGDGISVIDRRLSFLDKTAAEKFIVALCDLETRSANETAIETRTFAAPRAGGKRPYLVALRRLPVSESNGSMPRVGRGAEIIVVIRDPVVFPEIDMNLLRQSYDLSPAELNLAVALDGGATVRDIAAGRGVAISTVRTQLYALMGKLYVNRQTDLVRLLRQYRPPF